MSISVDTINLRFNVKPDYDQQKLQQLQEDLTAASDQLHSPAGAVSIAIGAVVVHWHIDADGAGRLADTADGTLAGVIVESVLFRGAARQAVGTLQGVRAVGSRSIDGIGGTLMVADFNHGIFAIPAGWHALVIGEERDLARLIACMHHHVVAKAKLTLMACARQTATDGIGVAAAARPCYHGTARNPDYSAVRILTATNAAA